MSLLSKMKLTKFISIAAVVVLAAAEPLPQSCEFCLYVNIRLLFSRFFFGLPAKHHHSSHLPPLNTLHVQFSSIGPTTIFRLQNLNAHIPSMIATAIADNVLSLFLIPCLFPSLWCALETLFMILTSVQFLTNVSSPRLPWRKFLRLACTCYIIITNE